MTEETLYLRGKMAERGTSKAKFDQDGFDFWAETEAPARAGQVEKVPAESTKPTMEGDALKRLYARHQARQRRRGGAEASPQGSVGGAMCGCEELEGGYISSWVPVFGGYPTSLSEFKEWAPKNKDKVAKFIDLAKNNSVVKKYVPASVIAMAEDFARSQGYLEGDGTKKGMKRKTARRAYEPMEGGYISSWVPVFGGYPTSLSEFKEWAPKNKDKVAKFIDLAKNNSVVKKYVPASVIAMAEDFARSQGYLEGGWADGSPEYDEAYQYLISKKASPTTARKIALETDLTPKQMQAKYDAAFRRGSGSKARKPSARNMIVKKVMAEHGLSLPQASKYVKEHGLY